MTATIRTQSAPPTTRKNRQLILSAMKRSLFWRILSIFPKNRRQRAPASRNLPLSGRKFFCGAAVSAALPFTDQSGASRRFVDASRTEDQLVPGTMATGIRAAAEDRIENIHRFAASDRKR